MKRILKTIFTSFIFVIACFLFLSACTTKEIPPVEVTYEITIPVTSVEVVKGNSITLTANATASDGSTPVVIWSSNDEAIAKVDGTGIVTGIATGSTVVTATLAADADAAASVRVVVTPLTYKVTYINGESSWTEEVEENGKPELPVLAEEGFVFDGWSYDQAGISKAYADEIITEDVTFYAQWTEIITWTITYVTKGKCDGPTTYQNIDGTLELPTPVWHGHEFVGWWNNAEFSGMPVSFISSRSEGDLTYYAKWINPDISSWTFSVLGDSISTFEGEIPSGYSFFYPLYSKHFTSGPITTSDKMWFHLLEGLTGMSILMNDSYSGTTVSSQWPNSGESAARIVNLATKTKKPNVIVIWMGVNDLVSGLAPTTFKEAYAHMIERIESVYPRAYIVCCSLSYQYSRNISLWEPYCTAIREVTETYDLGFADLASVITPDNYLTYLGDHIHLNSFGQALVSETVAAAIYDYFDIEVAS